MDRSLWLLLALRLRAWVRRFARGVRSPRGLLLAVVGLLVFLPMVFSVALSPTLVAPEALDSVRRFGPAGLLAYALLSVLASTSEKALTFRPAEVAFLFPGPYRPRQLLLYKVAAGTFGAALTAVLTTVSLGGLVPRFVSGCLGVFLAVELIYLISLAAGLVVSAVGTLAYDRLRRVVLAGAAVLAAAALVPVARSALELPPAELARRALGSPVLRAAALPFRPPVMVFASTRWDGPTAGWLGAGVLVDALALGLVLSLHAGLLEAAARVHDRRGRERRAAPPDSGVVRRPAFTLPDLPWWGGAGPTAWRQTLTALRAPARLVSLGGLLLAPPLFGRLTARLRGEGFDTPAALSVVGTIVLFAPTLIAYDFRNDLDRIAALKALPVRPTRLVVGQLLVPWLALSLGEAATLGITLALAGAPGGGPLGAAAVAFLPPLNLILLAVGNLYFLWFPFRTGEGSAPDAAALGRQVVQLAGRVVTAGLAVGVSVGAGLLARLVSGRDEVGYASAWVVLFGCGLALVPLVAVAFQAYDVAETPPE